jgi:hypothetical protein
MEVKWIEYKGKNILYVDYQDAKSTTDMIKIGYSLKLRIILYF